jgi:hypothetical protein
MKDPNNSILSCGGALDVRDGLEQGSRGGPLRIGGSAGTTNPRGIGRPKLKEGS